MLFVRLGLEAIGLLLGVLVGTMVSLLLPAVNEMRGIRFQKRDIALLRKLLSYGAPLTVTFALGIVVSASDRFMIGWLLDEAAVGRYAVGSTWHRTRSDSCSPRSISQAIRSLCGPWNSRERMRHVGS